MKMLRTTIPTVTSSLSPTHLNSEASAAPPLQLLLFYLLSFIINMDVTITLCL